MPTPIFYDLNQCTDRRTAHISSADTPARFMDFAEFRDAQTGNFHPIRSFKPAKKEDLCLVLGPKSVEGVSNGRDSNGFENKEPHLPSTYLWAIGSLLAASRAALADPAQPTCSPTSGFHHAHYEFGGNFRIFNGLLVVIAKLLQEQPHLKIGILDCDFHYGDGTDDQLRNQPTLARSIVLHTSCKNLHPIHDAVDYFQWLQLAINDINRKECDLVIYLAGAGTQKNDPLSGMLTTRELRDRDRAVFGRMRSAIAWSFAGGYQENLNDSLEPDSVLQTHWNTLVESDLAGRMRKSRIGS
ncbi:Histone deacetylase domain containing protein [Comamonadaceae bacterium]